MHTFHPDAPDRFERLNAMVEQACGPMDAGPPSKPLPYRAPTYCPHPMASSRTRKRNLAALNARVAAWLDWSAGLEPDDAAAYLNARARSVEDTIGKLACGPDVKGLRGLDVHDLHEVVRALEAAAARTGSLKVVA